MGLLWLVIIEVYTGGYMHGMVIMSTHVGYDISLTMQYAWCKVACPFK